MNGTLVLRKTFKSFGEHGLRATLVTMIRRMIELVRPVKPDEFDLKRGTDTAGSAQLWGVGKIDSENASHGVGYGTRDEARTLALLHGLPRDSTFVDLGCGKGRVLIIAKENGFRDVVGVEFAKEFADTARENLRICGLQAGVIHGDAMKHDFPDGPLVVYMYNPFNEVVMKQVVANLRRHKGELWVAYANPRYDLFSKWMDRVQLSPEQSKLFTDKEAAIWRSRRSN